MRKEVNHAQTRKCNLGEPRTPLHQEVLLRMQRLPRTPSRMKIPQYRRRVRAAGYLTAGLLIITSLFLSWNSTMFYVAAAVETWWVWASLTGLEHDT